MEKEASESTSSWPPADVPLRRWQETATYECYMVDSNRAGQDYDNGAKEDLEYRPGDESGPC